MANKGDLLIEFAIHDFDLARFPVGGVEEIICKGNVRFCEYGAEPSDVDTATTLLKVRKGAQEMMQHCRRAALGHDVMRLEN